MLSSAATMASSRGDALPSGSVDRASRVPPAMAYSMNCLSSLAPAEVGWRSCGSMDDTTVRDLRALVTATFRRRSPPARLSGPRD